MRAYRFSRAPRRLRSIKLENVDLREPTANVVPFTRAIEG